MSPLGLLVDSFHMHPICQSARHHLIHHYPVLVSINLSGILPQNSDALGTVQRVDRFDTSTSTVLATPYRFWYAFDTVRPP